MAKRLKITKSKNSESFYIIDDFTDPQSKKRSTFIVERLGSLKNLKSQYNTDSRDEILSILNDHVNELRRLDKENNALIPVMLSPSKLISPDDQRFYNIGYIFILETYYLL